MTMSQYGQSLLGAAIALRTALERTGDALATPRLAALLETEAGLAAALAVLPGPNAEFGGTREQVLHELARAREELKRCQRLGDSLSKTLRSVQNPGDSSAYGADGRAATESGRPSGRLQARG
jgi:hypothetical protein